MEINSSLKSGSMYPGYDRQSQGGGQDSSSLSTGKAGGAEKMVSLGRLSKSVPTVSELIYETPLKNQCWKIVFSDVNSDKPFNTIKPGTEIFFNKETRELVWGERAEALQKGESESRGGASATASIDHMADPVKGGVPDSRLPEPGFRGSPSSPLVSAVSRFIGEDYSKMDCYEMVIGGLEKMGVKYQGRGGLGEHLIRGAVDKGMVYNHYLNGEGLVTQSGEAVYKKTLFPGNLKRTDPSTLMDEMAGLLEPGQILSFSTRTMGHTGVVSKNRGMWTFINSGTMDNSLAGNNGAKGVGEEELEKELYNWLKHARQKGQGLKITLGAMDMEKLARLGFTSDTA